MANRGVVQPVDIVDPVDATGNVKVTVVGGVSSTEYDDGDARGTATGGLILGDDGTNVQSIAVDTAGILKTLLTAVDETSRVASTTIVNSGTTILVNVAAGEQATIDQVYIASNNGFTPCIFDVRFTVGGTAHYTTQLVSKGSRIPNLLVRPIQGGVGEDFYINLNTATSNLEVTVQYRVD